MTTMTKGKKPPPSKGKKRNSQEKSTGDNEKKVVDIFTKKVVQPKKIIRAQKNIQLFRSFFEQFLKEEGKTLQDCVILYTAAGDLKDPRLVYGVYEDETNPPDPQTLTMLKSYFETWMKERVWGEEEEED